jgi:hypothetical protein
MGTCDRHPWSAGFTRHPAPNLSRQPALSKPERGYALSVDRAGKPVRSGPIQLDPAVTTGAAFQTIALSCLDHAAANRRAVREGDTEGIHQMRVGCAGCEQRYQYSRIYGRGRRRKQSRLNLNGLPTSWARRAILTCSLISASAHCVKPRRSPMRSACSSGIWR